MSPGGLEVDQLGQSYGAKTALSGVCFTAMPGSITGIVGANGSGKTTLLRMCVGVATPDTGTVIFGGRPVIRLKRNEIGYMPEERGLYPSMTVRRELEFFASLAGLAVVSALAAAEQVGLTSELDTKVSTLSLGNQQRVQLAVAFISKPTLVVLDEPFSGLDPDGIEAMSGVIVAAAARGATVLLSSHQLELLQSVAADVVVLVDGRVKASGSVRELLDSSVPHFLAKLPAPDALALHPGLVLDPRDDGWTKITAESMSRAELLKVIVVDGGAVDLREVPATLADVYREART